MCFVITKTVLNVSVSYIQVLSYKTFPFLMTFAMFGKHKTISKIDSFIKFNQSIIEEFCALIV